MVEQIVNLTEVPIEPRLTEAQLSKIMEVTMESNDFRRYAGRSILGMKAFGTPTMKLSPAHEVLAPVVAAMTELAAWSLEADEDLALVQLLVNRYRDGSDEVKSHRHRCRQICLALGAEREIEVDGRVHLMRHGDCIHLGGEVHSVPAAQTVAKPRISICLFYGSAKEYERKSISVNWMEGWHGSSMWWEHPEDVRRNNGTSI